MKTLLAASLLAAALATPALAQSTDGTIGRTSSEAVGDASILPGGAVPGGTSTDIISDDASGSAGSRTGLGSIDRGTTQSTVPDVSIPNAGISGQATPGDNGIGTPMGSGTGAGMSGSTQLNRDAPGAGLGSVPRSGGGISSSSSGAGVPSGGGSSGGAL